MSSKRNYFKLAYGIEETEEKVYIEDAEKEFALLDGAGAELMAEESANDKLMNTLVEDSKTISDMYGIMEKGIETSDGINSDTEAVVATAIESILRRHGMKRHISLPKRPSVESFDSKRGRLVAAENLRISLEGIFEKIKAGILKLWEWLKKIWAKFFSKNNKKKLETLEEMVEYLLKALDDESLDENIKLPIKIDFKASEKIGSLTGKFYDAKEYFSPANLDRNFKLINEDYEKFNACLDNIIENDKARSVKLSGVLSENKAKSTDAKIFKDYDGLVINSRQDMKAILEIIFKKMIPFLSGCLDKYEDQINTKMDRAEDVIQQIKPGVEASEKDRGIWGNVLAKFGVERPQDVLRIIRQQAKELIDDVNSEINGLVNSVVKLYHVAKASKPSGKNKE